MTDYIEAHREAERMLEAGEIVAYACGHSRERGRYIEVETDQGWNPDPFWIEFDGLEDRT